MSCTGMKQLEAMALAGDASEEQTEALGRHARGCERCRVEGDALGRLAEALQVAAPPVVETQRDLVGAALEIAERDDLRPLRRAARSRAKWLLAPAAAAVLLLVLLPVSRERPSLLSVLEAAMEAEPTHTVAVIVDDFTGEAIARAESWRSPSGDALQTLDPVGEGTTTWHLHRPGVPVSFDWDEQGAVTLHRASPEPNRTLEQMSRETLPTQVPSALPSEARGMLQWAQLTGAELTVHERQTQLSGRDVCLIGIRAPIPARNMPGGHVDERYPMEFRIYLTPDKTRLVRMVWRSPSDGYTRLRTEMEPIEYDTGPPAALFELPGTTATFRGDPVELIWETWPEAEKQKLRETFDAIARAWCEGDADEFARYLDTEVALTYAVKGKFTAEQLRDRLAWHASQQPKRWKEHSLRFDYAVGSTKPAAWTLQYWSLHTEKGTLDGNWRLYREKPSEEPGIIVLARERVAPYDNAAGELELGTLLFMRKIDGEYKLLLWAPPFG